MLIVKLTDGEKAVIDEAVVLKPLSFEEKCTKVRECALRIVESYKEYDNNPDVHSYLGALLTLDDFHIKEVDIAGNLESELTAMIGEHGKNMVTREDYFIMGNV